MKNSIWVIVQGFYGNRTATQVDPAGVDRFILGFFDSEIPAAEPIDRSVIRIPETKDIVLIYNKYQESKALESKKRAYEQSGYVCKPLAAIPEKGIELYSRCIVCRMDKNGELKSIGSGDEDKYFKYLAK